MIDQKEWATWVGKGSLPATLSVPLNGSDPGVSEAVAGGFEVLNRAFKHYAAVTKEPSLSLGERSRAQAEGQRYLNGAVTRAVNAATSQFKELSERAARERESFTKGTLSDDMALALAVQVRTLGKSVISSDPRFAQAINRCPAAVAGLSDEDVKSYTNNAIEKHNPDLAALERSVALSRHGVQRLERVALHLAGQVEKSIDPDALAKNTEFRSLLLG